MSPEMLLEAMQYLPDEMLIQTDKLRQKRSVNWKKWASLAACLCLVAGMACFVLFPGMTSKDGAAPDNRVEEDAAEITDQSGNTKSLEAVVEQVLEESLFVTLSTGEKADVLLTQVAEVPSLQPGQTIYLYLKESLPPQNAVLAPYRIEIKEETP